MRKIFLPTIFYLLLLTACSSRELLPQASVSSVVIVEPTSDFSASPVPPSPSSEQQGVLLSPSTAAAICDNLHTSVDYCKDGSEILEISVDYENWVYVRLTPNKLSNGGYEFFQKLCPSEDIIYNGDGSAEIPVCVNNSGEFRFMLKAYISAPDGRTDRTLTVLNSDDIAFSEMYAQLDYNAREAYRMSLAPDVSLSDDELAGFFRACVYSGNMYLLDELYKLTPEDDIDSRYKLELAGIQAYNSNISISDGNPYKAEVFYGESSKSFPQTATLDIAAKSLQTGNSLDALGAEELESNYDWKSVYKIPNFRDFYEYLYEDEKPWGVHKLDLDKDGLTEILIFFPGGTMGNEFFEILHLDESGLITDVNSAEGMSTMALYRFNGEYFVTSNIIDFYDKEFLGWEIYALGENAEMYTASVWLEKSDSEIVFTDEYVKRDFYVDWMLDGYIDLYKSYGYDIIGKELEPSDEVKALFGDEVTAVGEYGILDINNDGTDDFTNVYMHFTSNRYPYYCNYVFIDGVTNQALDFPRHFIAGNYSLCRVIPYRNAERNYFVLMFNGYGNYIFKLIEITGMEPKELQSWLVSVEKRILIKVSKDEDTGLRFGV